MKRSKGVEPLWRHVASQVTFSLETQFLYNNVYMSTIDTILFDVGGVYMQGRAKDFVAKSKNLLGITEIPNSPNAGVFDPDLNKGTVSHEECFRKYFAVPITDDQMAQILEYWKTTWTPDTQMVGLIKMLKNLGYKTAVLSNSDSLNSAKYKKMGWYDPFDVLILSHELGVIKPDPRIYEIALQKVGEKAEDCIFIDDVEENLAPASKLGIKTIHHKDFNNTINELERLLNKHI